MSNGGADAAGALVTFPRVVDPRRDLTRREFAALDGNTLLPTLAPALLVAAGSFWPTRGWLLGAVSYLLLHYSIMLSY